MLPTMGPQSPLLLDDKSAIQLLLAQYNSAERQQRLTLNSAQQHTSSERQPMSPVDLNTLHNHEQPLSPGLSPALSPVNAYLQFQLMHRNNALTSQNQVTSTHKRLDRSVSEPYPSARDVTLKQHTSQQQQQINKNVLNPNRYKTEMCRTFVENGYCKYGDKCQFAHGTQEQRGLARHPKYKTEYCKTFHTSGICSYGSRCHFIHNEDETKLSEIGQMKRHHAAIQAAQEMTKQATQLQLQNQLMQNQLQSLVSQVNQQLISQLSIRPVTSHVDTHKATSSRPVLTHSVSVHPRMHHYSVGSMSETPPESLCTSPILSPTFPYSDESASDSHSDTISGILTPPIGGDLNSSFSYCSSAECSPFSPRSPQKHSASTHSDVTNNIISSLHALALENQCTRSAAASLTRSRSSAGDYRRMTSTHEDSNEHSRLPIFSQIVGR